MAEAGKGQVGTREMDEDEPRGHEVGKVMQEVRVSDAINGGADGEEEH